MGGQNKSVIVVLGMHRGGTSCVARALLALGIPLGDSLLPPGHDNPTGFWEDTVCVSINEEPLLGSTQPMMVWGTHGAFLNRTPELIGLGCPRELRCPLLPPARLRLVISGTEASRL